MLGGGGAISLNVKSHNNFATAREIKFASRHCCDKTMDDSMALYRVNETMRT